LMLVAPDHGCTAHLGWSSYGSPASTLEGSENDLFGVVRQQ
jgi:hypothetical protein